MIFLLYGGLSSTQYALFYSEKSYSSWAPYTAPVKIIMSFGIALMLLRAIATFFRDLARARGLTLDEEAPGMSYESIAVLMFSSMMLMLLTGQRVFGAIGFVAVVAALFLWGDGGSQLAFSAAMKLMKWYPLLTLPLFIYMGFMLSESKIADDLYQMFHVWMGPHNGGLAIGTIILMVVISAMNGLTAR